MRDARTIIVQLEVTTSVPLYMVRRAHLLVTGEAPDVHAMNVKIRSVEHAKEPKRPRRRK